MEKDDKINHTLLLFFYTIDSTLCSYIQNFKTPAVLGAEKSVTNIFIEEKEKWTNEGNETYEDADYLLLNTTRHTQSLYQISKY